jgi:hypothetical protein
LQDIDVPIRTPVIETLPRAAYKLVPEDGRAMVEYRRPTCYVRYTGRTEDDELEACVDYDMDSDDEQWLVSYNRAHREDTPLREYEFETIVDRFEKAAFRIDRNSHSTLRQLAIDESDDVCVVCLDGVSEDANQIVYCDGCDTAFH